MSTMFTQFLLIFVNQLIKVIVLYSPIGGIDMDT